MKECCKKLFRKKDGTVSMVTLMGAGPGDYWYSEPKYCPECGGSLSLPCCEYYRFRIFNRMYFGIDHSYQYTFCPECGKKL